MSPRSAWKRIITLYSETVWIYFGLALYAKIEWQITQPLHPGLLAIACLTGFLSQWLLGKWRMWNALFVLPILYWGWSSTAHLGFSYAGFVLFTVLFLFVRSSWLAYREPTRNQLLLRLEGNIIWYILFLLVIHAHPEVSERTHLPFVIGILLSLVAMVLTLHPEQTEQDHIQVRVVGGMTHLTLPLLGIFSLAIVFTLFALLPIVRNGLVSLLKGMGETGLWLGNGILKGFVWLLTLFPVKEEPSGILPAPVPEPHPPVSEGGMLQAIPFPLEAVGVILALFVLGAIWLISQLKLKKWNAPTITTSVIRIQKQAFWKTLWRRFLTYWKQWMGNWKRRLPGYDRLPIYRAFHLLERWGKKQGFPRLPAETPREYALRVSHQVAIPDVIEYKGREFPLREGVRKVGESFSHAYYSPDRKMEDEDWGPLLWYLRK
ncbi:DUF4129 domain-containing protein [Ammoniphilus sp. YIM 78166]|uniref:DUF4129 domain-containing protein n=1 Tax=Ammoniphilus sp. YIM 78166 TaxID=1644106 RepID=UPI00106FAF82|nr:DUF4129 domain-containing protein [Ammoniphilus sp. YIM 78166]